ncbi:hypothetical protein Lalb_Chr12g0206671 [Lupinus albus]|uniref:Uncharacterized protein n=1 Tax=Lupinus albus TaxID=3870 RepID=A0A6A4PNN5_LUPAL|nr:hypothetical protein Lalb_Chr12g0206671 [Lupinus albus]
MFNKLCLSPSTYSTPSIVVDGGLPILPTPSIFPLLLLPYVTYPLSLGVRINNLSLLFVMCFEQPLSKYHKLQETLKFSYMCFDVSFGSYMVSTFLYPFIMT